MMQWQDIVIVVPIPELGGGKKDAGKPVRYMGLKISKMVPYYPAQNGH